MTLLVDLGNSRLKWAWLGDDGALSEGGRAPLGAEPLEAVLEQSFEALDAPARVRVASVRADAEADRLQAWVAQRWGITPELALPAAEGWGVQNAYTEPARLGVDRWLALVAARRRGGRPAVVVDCGTAVTVDALDGGGRHLGGLILPGLAMMRGALQRDAHGIGDATSTEPALLARSTGDAVAAGTLYTLVAAIDRISGDISHALGRGTRHLLTGGDAATVLPLLAGRWEHAPLLVLEGLAATAEPG